MLSILASISLSLGASLSGANQGHSNSLSVTTTAITNLRLAGDGFVAGERALFGVIESQQGQDVNGDGDLGDVVLHVRELASGMTWNTGLSTPSVLSERSIGVSDRFLIAPVPERPRDLNGDGDDDDFVLHAADLATRRITNLGLASTDVQLAGDQAGFLVSEGAQGGMDLNGDGDALDSVAFVYSQAGGVRNLGLAVPRFTVVPEPVVYLVDGRLLVFLVGEAAQGGQDLNGDGDTNDAVLHVYDGATDTVRMLGLVQDASRSDLRLFAVHEPLVIFGVPESTQGPAVDLNGDGDVLDLVPHVYRSDTGTTRNLGLASFGLQFAATYVVGERFVSFLVAESQQGGADLNGDPDRNDVVTFVYDAESDSILNLQLAARPLDNNQDVLLVAHGRRLAFRVSEAAQRRDLNGDADRNDTVLHVLDVDAGPAENLRFVASEARFSDKQVAFRVSEAAQGNHDLDGDGDTRDAVLFVHDVTTHTTRSSATSAEPVYALGGDVCLFETGEFLEGDLNGDGDTGDRLVRAFGCASGGVIDLGLARGGFLGLARSLSARRYALFSVDEFSQQSSDLNRDGDVNDHVLHVARLDEITRLP